MNPRRRRALALVMASELYLGTGLAQAVEVAVLKSGAPASWRPVVDALRRTARAHHFTEYELPADPAQARQAVTNMRGRAAVLVALGSLAVQAGRAGLPDIPLVYCMVVDPVGAGLLPAPAPHVSGVLFDVPVRNQLAAFRMVNPRAVRIGVLYSPEHSAAHVREAEKAAPTLRLVVTARAVGAEREVPTALRALLAGPDAVDALWLPPDALLLAADTRRFLFEEMARAGKAVHAFSSALMADGALASNGPDLVSVGHEAAGLVDRLAVGERGVEARVPRAELLVNLRVAARLHVTIPEAALKAARKY
jgi:putative ABC transport system substrate-binding protein